MAQFSDRMVPEVVQVFWAAMARGEFVTAAAAEAGTYREKGTRWLRVEGGIRPRRGRDLKGRGLTFYDREEIAVARAGGESMRSIARRLGRRPSTISRELGRNAGRAGPTLAERAEAIGARCSPSRSPGTADGFFHSYWRRPHAYLQPPVRRATSVWASSERKPSAGR